MGDCPTAMATFQGVSPAGSITFNADMTYTANGEALNTTIDLSWPQACLTNGETCAQFQAGLQAEVNAAATCSGSTSCTCSIPDTIYVTGSTTGNDTGTYALNAETVTLTSSTAGTTPQTFYYCVASGGSTLLHLITFGMPTANAPNTIEADIVATKQ